MDVLLTSRRRRRRRRKTCHFFLLMTTEEEEGQSSNNERRRSFSETHPGFWGGGVIGGKKFGNPKIGHFWLQTDPQQKSIPRDQDHAHRSHRSHRTCISWIKTIAMNTRTTPARCSPANDLRRLSQMISSLEKDKVWEAAAASAKATRPSQTPSSRYLTDFRA